MEKKCINMGLALCGTVLSWTSFRPMVMQKEKTLTLPCQALEALCCTVDGRLTDQGPEAEPRPALSGFRLVGGIGERFLEEVAFVPDSATGTLIQLVETKRIEYSSPSQGARSPKFESIAQTLLQKRVSDIAPGMR